ncbi:hypothetical protein JR316_0010665 [Psilocybe cubensis]|uniref:Uncharacterized protein n=1 Tax=Psilocybe cubensis TaxID=181762 RepID=A0ACB8GP20_PSICU|nr:hypothetical protein JR316_0010665 [Psilocybe cubensis]KAH9476750.1 hypothetical protein JR316_0010665 [Psilocybe cubensis]
MSSIALTTCHRVLQNNCRRKWPGWWRLEYIKGLRGSLLRYVSILTSSSSRRETGVACGVRRGALRMESSFLDEEKEYVERSAPPLLAIILTLIPLVYNVFEYLLANLYLFYYYYKYLRSDSYKQIYFGAWRIFLKVDLQSDQRA